LGSAGVRRRTAARAAGESGAAQEGGGTAPAVDGEEEGGHGWAREPLTGSARSHAQAVEGTPGAGLPGQPRREKGSSWAPAALGGVDATTVAVALLGAAAGGAVAGPWGVTAGAPQPRHIALSCFAGLCAVRGSELQGRCVQCPAASLGQGDGGHTPAQPPHPYLHPAQAPRAARCLWRRAPACAVRRRCTRRAGVLPLLPFASGAVVSGDAGTCVSMLLCLLNPCAAAMFVMLPCNLGIRERLPVESRLIPCLYVAWAGTAHHCYVHGWPRRSTSVGPAPHGQPSRDAAAAAAPPLPPGGAPAAPGAASASAHNSTAAGEPGASGDAKNHPAWGWDLGAHHAAASAAAAAATAAALAAEAAVAASGAASAAVAGLWRREQPAEAPQGGAARGARPADGSVVRAADAAATGSGSAPAASERGGSDAGHVSAAAPAQAGVAQRAKGAAEPRAAGRVTAPEGPARASANAEQRALNARALAQGRSSELPVSFEPAQSLPGGSLG